MRQIQHFEPRKKTWNEYRLRMNTNDSKETKDDRADASLTKETCNLNHYINKKYEIDTT